MRALVLSGGGSKGAYEVGVLKHLLGDLRTDYDLFAGVSVGAINASYLACFADPEAAVSALEKLWAGMSNAKVYKNWFPPYISALWKPSVYDSSPLWKLIREELAIFPAAVKASGKKLRIGSTGLDTGTYQIFDETFHDVPTAVLASSAFPALLTPVELDGQLWTDGGVKSTTPLKAAIQAGATDIDVVLCSPPGDGSEAFAGKTTALAVAARAIGLMSDQIEANDLVVCGLVNSLVDAGKAPGKVKVNLRIVRPTQILVQNPLDFGPTLLKAMTAQGYMDAVTQLEGA
jgi:NTE family protein